MKPMDILETMGSIRDAYVVEAHEEKKRHISLTRTLLIAAIISLLLLLVGCAVVYMLRLQDMKVGEITVSEPAWSGPGGEEVPATEWVKTELSLQGYNGSPEQLAMQEWNAFQDSYDPDGSLLTANNFNESGVPAQFNETYGCYTFEMVDKLQEILDKYNLQPLGAILHFDRWEQALFYRALQMQPLVSVDTESMAGYFFPEGSFHTAFRYTLPGEETRLAAYTYVNGDYFYPYYTVIGNIDQWQQWHYTTADGADLLLAAYENALMIIYQNGNDWIHIRTENPGYDVYNTPNKPMTREAAQRIADIFNYRPNPQPCTAEQVEAMRAEYPAPESKEQFLAYSTFDSTTGWQWFINEHSDSLENYVQHILDYTQNYAGNGKEYDGTKGDMLDYCFFDLDSDGEQEMLLKYRDTGRYWQVVKVFTPPREDSPRVCFQYFQTLYEGPILSRSYDETVHGYGDCVYTYYLDGSLHEFLRLCYNTVSKTWQKATVIDDSTDGGTKWESISEAEAKEIQTGYVPMADFDWNPLTGFLSK